MPLTVTFDTNTLESVVSPDAAQSRAGHDTGPSGAAVRAAIQAGRLQGFFSETHITTEGINSDDRKDILYQTRIASSADGDTLTVGVHHIRKPPGSRFHGRVQRASALGMCALMAPARIAGIHVKNDICPLFEPKGGQPELWRCMEKVNDMATKIACRGVGIAIAIELGKQSSKEAGILEPELWLTGLGRAQSKKKLSKAIREWADGDVVAAHYGFGIDLLSSEDCGKKSVFETSNREWLSKDFGIRFVTLAELAEIVASL